MSGPTKLGPSPQVLPTHVCRVCNARWRDNGNDTYTLCDLEARDCCDNVSSPLFKRHVLSNPLPSVAVKDDSAKLPVSLFPGEALLEITKVLAFGARKYARHNWRKGMEWSRMYDALQRHLLAFQSGENIDRESGLLHLAHAGACLIFLLTYQVTSTGTDDRWKP